MNRARCHLHWVLFCVFQNMPNNRYLLVLIHFKLIDLKTLASHLISESWHFTHMSHSLLNCLTETHILLLNYSSVSCSHLQTWHTESLKVQPFSFWDIRISGIWHEWHTSCSTINVIWVLLNGLYIIVLISKFSYNYFYTSIVLLDMNTHIFLFIFYT